jgi:hypothetical protein
LWIFGMAGLLYGVGEVFDEDLERRPGSATGALWQPCVKVR